MIVDERLALNTTKIGDAFAKTASQETSPPAEIATIQISLAGFLKNKTQSLTVNSGDNPNQKLPQHFKAHEIK